MSEEQRILFPLGSELERQFFEFHEENPHVYTKLLEIAFFVRRRGHGKFGIAAIFERLRWVSLFETTGDPYKLNNNHRAFYARLLMDTEPGLKDFFEIRRSVSDDMENP